MKFSSPAISLGLQVYSMQQDFPGFRYKREKNIPTWYGSLKPFQDSNGYLIKIAYRFDNQYSKRPSVWVMSPKLAINAPHIYPKNKSLCLYYPKDQTWNPHKFISKVIVPLTAAWLGLYELWLSTYIWYGPEAPHSGIKE